MIIEVGNIVKKIKCSKCNKVLPATEDYFYKNKAKKGGLEKKCKECTKATVKKYRESNPQLIIERKKQDYEANKEYYKQYKAQYYIKNKSRMRKLQEIYREENREQIAEWREANNDYYVTWRRENKEKMRIQCQRRRARTKSLPATLTETQWEDILQYFDRRCAYCGEENKKLHQDHVVPLSKGGKYAASNIVPACKSCNSKKHAKNMEKWYMGQPFFSYERLLLIRGAHGIYAQEPNGNTG